jgi:peptidoglycan/LPS O-acetylase OafA/YrhL
MSQPSPRLAQERVALPVSEPVLRPVMPELDAVRGIAILAVLFYHGFYWAIDLSRFNTVERIFLNGMWLGRLGVNLFFVLSGLLITGLLIDSRTRENYYRRFYVRRVLRIVPAYMLTLLVLLGTRAAPVSFIWLSVAYLSNLTPLFGVPIAYPVLWSLGVEEHFYLGWPAVVRRLSNRALLLVCGFIVLVSPLLRLWTYYAVQRHGYLSYEVFDYTWNSADGLACGAMLAIFLREYSVSRRTLARLALAVVTVGVAIYAAGLPFGIITRRAPVGAALQVVPFHLVFVGGIIAFLLVGSGPWKKWSRWPALEFFGEISYGLYLYHLLFFSAFEWCLNRGYIRTLEIDPFAGLVIRFVVLGSVAVATAYLSRRYFEEAFLRLKGKVA